PNVDGVPVAKRFLFRLHFSQGNDALDFLCAGGALPDDIFHRAHARDYLTRRKFLRILAKSSRSYSDVELAFHSLRAALPQKDRVKRGRLGSACVSRAGCGVPPQQSFLKASICGPCVAVRKVRDGEDAIANTRDACA